MASKKKSGSVGVNVVDSAALGGVHPLPVNTPKPPADYVATKGGKRKGRRPKAVQVATAPAVAKELLRDPNGYIEEFGKKAPAPAHVAAILTAAAGWSAVAQDARAFEEYAREQNAQAWDSALGVVRLLEPGFAFAVARDASARERFPALANMIGGFRRSVKHAPRRPKSGDPTTAPKTSKVVVEGTPLVSEGGATP